MVFPIYWYTYPGFSKLYMDEVFCEGFAKNSATREKPLANKEFTIAVSCGGAAN